MKGGMREGKRAKGEEKRGEKIRGTHFSNDPS
jgi:hypothetical protein